MALSRKKLKERVTAFKEFIDNDISMTKDCDYVAGSIVDYSNSQGDVRIFLMGKDGVGHLSYWIEKLTGDIFLPDRSGGKMRSKVSNLLTYQTLFWGYGTPINRSMSPDVRDIAKEIDKELSDLWDRRDFML